MKKFDILYILYLVFLTASFISLVFFSDKVFIGKKSNPTSPLPYFLTSYYNKEVRTLDLWFPSIGNFLETLNSSFIEKKPQISAKSALLYDLTDDKILFEKNPDKRLPIASLTKIATIIIAIENKKADDRYQVKKEDLVGENSMGLTEGEIFSLEDLLYGLVLNSGNDAAETLASNYKEGRSGFIAAMNNKARSLGLSDTNFTNPTGLEGDGDQYSTTYDLLILTKHALTFPLVRKVVRAFNYEIPMTSFHKAFFLENETNLLTSYPGVMGVKDGYTSEAGLCLITYLNYKGHKIIGVLLGSDNRRQEMKDLLDYGLKIQGITPPPHS